MFMANGFEHIDVWKGCRRFRKSISVIVKTFQLKKNIV